VAHGAGGPGQRHGRGRRPAGAVVSGRSGCGMGTGAWARGARGAQVWRGWTRGHPGGESCDGLASKGGGGPGGAGLGGRGGAPQAGQHDGVQSQWGSAGGGAAAAPAPRPPTQAGRRGPRRARHARTGARARARRHAGRAGAVHAASVRRARKTALCCTRAQLAARAAPRGRGSAAAPGCGGRPPARPACRRVPARPARTGDPPPRRGPGSERPVSPSAPSPWARGAARTAGPPTRDGRGGRGRLARWRTGVTDGGSSARCLKAFATGLAGANGRRGLKWGAGGPSILGDSRAQGAPLAPRPREGGSMGCEDATGAGALSEGGASRRRRGRGLGACVRAASAQASPAAGRAGAAATARRGRLQRAQAAGAGRAVAGVPHARRGAPRRRRPA
jgi:hypothetical protein